jgi:hypothetical protein
LGLFALTSGGAAQASRLNERFAKSPPALQDGTATIELVKGWLARDATYLSGPPSWVTREQDLDLDGIADLLIADPRLSGSGGSSYAAFLRTPHGFRFLGDFVGSIRALRSMRGHVVIATASGSGFADLQLAEIRSDGFHRLASVRLAAGDSGTEDGNRLYRELMRSDAVSVELLRRVFGPIVESADGLDRAVLCVRWRWLDTSRFRTVVRCRRG